MDLKNTKTAENLRKALAGESIARNKYTYFAAAARACGNKDIADAFEEMAINEMTHAKFWFEQLYGKPTETKDCLIKAAHGEYEEWHNMYPDFAKQAREEGLEELATMFDHVAEIERSHENRFMTMLAKLCSTDPKTVTTDDHEEEIVRVKKNGYRCQFCGATFENRPDYCRTCGAIGSFEAAEYYE